MSYVLPQIEPEKWAKTYGLKIRTEPCANCGISQTTNIPFASKKWRGLLASEHSCGQNFRLMTAVRSSDQERYQWQSIHERLCTHLS